MRPLHAARLGPTKNWHGGRPLDEKQRWQLGIIKIEQRLWSAVDCACSQSPASVSQKSGSPVSAPCSSINRARLMRPCRSHLWHLISSKSSLPTSSARVMEPRVLTVEL